ncbi:MAG: hypothetical protein KBE09_05105 [Candidatus Pacebacteria bacterium]|nr:hypothetical protein [Candidatus Paceibacterota bacterium]
MYMRVAALAVVLAFALPHLSDAAVPPDTAAPTEVKNGCAPAAPTGVVPPSGTVAPPREIKGKNVGEIIKQLDPSTHDTVTIGGDGRVSVTSRCGVPGQQGSVTMCLMSGICVKVAKDKAVTEKIAELQKDPRFQDILNSGTPEKAAQELVTKLFEVKPGLQQELSRSVSGILGRAFGESGMIAGMVKDEVQKPADDIIRALAQGDFDAVAKSSQELAAKLKSSGILEELTNPKQWSSLLEKISGGQLTPQAREAFKALASVACDLTGNDCAQVTALGGSPRTGLEPVRAGLDRKIDPVEFAHRAAYKVSQSPLNGVAPAALRPFGITTGSPEEWARFFTMITKQESGLRVAAVASDGSLIRFASTLAGENSFGPGQFNIGEYGLKTWADVNDPDRVIDAYIQVAQRGNLFKYFGSLQRPNETLQHSSWYQNSVAPYVDGGVPYARPTTVAATTFEQEIARVASAPSTLGGLGQAFTNMLGGSGTNGITGMLGSLFNGNSSLSGLMGMLPKLLGGFMGGSSSSGSGGSAGSSASPGSSPAVGSTPQGGAPVVPVVQPITQPAIRLVASPRSVQKGDTYSIIWAATGVDEARACRLFEEGEVRQQIAVGNSDSVVRQVPAVTSLRDIVLTLECTPKDTRADSVRAKATVRITIAS